MLNTKQSFATVQIISSKSFSRQILILLSSRLSREIVAFDILDSAMLPRQIKVYTGLKRAKRQMLHKHTFVFSSAFLHTFKSFTVSHGA